MRRKPRPPGQALFDRQMIEQCLLTGALVGALAFALFAWLHLTLRLDLEAARNLTLLFLVSFSNVHVLNCRSETRSAFRIPFAANPLLIAGIVAAQSVHVAAMHIPLTQQVLSLQPVSFSSWGMVTSLALIVLLVGEAYKAVRARPLSVMRRSAPERLRS